MSWTNECCQSNNEKFIAKVQVGSSTIEVSEVALDKDFIKVYTIILEDKQTLCINEHEYNDIRTIMNMLDNKMKESGVE